MKLIDPTVHSGNACTRCHYSSQNIGGSVDGVFMCWRRGTNPAPGDDEISVTKARAPGMPCGPNGKFFEDCTL